MRQDTVVRFRKKDEVIDPLAQLLRRGARELIGQAVSEEFEVFSQRHVEQRDARGRQAVVRNGYLPEIEDGVRESTESWRGVLRDLKRRGLKIPPKLAVGEGALGFWAALEEQFPETRDQRCWFHKTGNVLNDLPKSAQPKAKSMLHEIWMAGNGVDAEAAFDRFVATYKAKYPKATESLAKDRASLLAFCDFPAEQWIHIRTTNPIESTFATIRHRTDRTKGCVSRSTLLGLVYRLGMSAQTRWRRLRGFERLGELIAAVKFVDGVRAQPRTRENRSIQQAAA